MESIKEFLFESTFFFVCMTGFIDLVCILEEETDKHTSNDYNSGNEKDPVFDPLLSVLLICFGITCCIISRLIILHRIVIFAVSVKRIGNTDICGIIVIVVLKNAYVIVNRETVVLILCILKSLCKKIAVCGS